MNVVHLSILETGTSMNYAPICLFVYNRLEHTKLTIEALSINAEAKDSDLYIFSDGPKTIEHIDTTKKLRAYLKKIKGFKSINIIEESVNKGLSRSVIDGVSRVLDQSNKVIVIEDDIVTSKYFLKYLNDGLSQYESDESVASIHAYTYPIPQELPETFFLKGADCWGWATWKRAWDNFNPNGQELLSELEERNLITEFNFNDSYPYSQMLKDQISGKNSCV